MVLFVLFTLFAYMVAATAGADSAAVTVTDVETGKVLICRPVAVGAPVVLAFTHSMYGGEVRETFLARRDGRLERIEMTTGNAAAAEYYAYTASVEPVGDRFRVVVPPAVYDEIVIRVDEVGRHRLRFGSEEIDLLGVAGNRQAVRLAAERVTAFNLFLGGPC